MLLWCQTFPNFNQITATSHMTYLTRAHPLRRNLSIPTKHSGRFFNLGMGRLAAANMKGFYSGAQHPLIWALHSGLPERVPYFPFQMTLLRCLNPARAGDCWNSTFNSKERSFPAPGNPSQPKLRRKRVLWWTFTEKPMSHKSLSKATLIRETLINLFVQCRVFFHLH